MAVLLDTNAVIGWMTGRVDGLTRRIMRCRDDVVLSSVVLHELAFGAFNSRHVDKNLKALDDLDLPVLVFDGFDAREAARIRADLKRRGTPIGPYDVLIAGQALARDLTVITNNVREFSRVDGLHVEDWTSV